MFSYCILRSLQKCPIKLCFHFHFPILVSAAFSVRLQAQCLCSAARMPKNWALGSARVHKTRVQGPSWDRSGLFYLDKALEGQCSGPQWRSSCCLLLELVTSSLTLLTLTSLAACSEDGGGSALLQRLCGKPNAQKNWSLKLFPYRQMPPVVLSLHL